jgi:hypothetical protein
MGAEFSEAEAAKRYGEDYYPPSSSRFTGWIAFAGMVMAMLGSFHVMQGLIAINNDDYFLVPESGLLAGISYGAWGWIYLLGGILILLAGLGLFTGKGWARAVAVVLAAFSAIGNFAFLAAYPLWATLMIGMNIMIIYAVSVHGGEMKEPAPPA